METLKNVYFVYPISVLL